jgi:hypothetical protein
LTEKQNSKKYNNQKKNFQDSIAVISRKNVTLDCYALWTMSRYMQETGYFLVKIIFTFKSYR